MGPHHVDFVSHWQLGAPVDRVWAALAEFETWPRWWPCVRSVRTLSAGADDGLGRVCRFEWVTVLPCRIVIDVETIETLRPERLRVRSHAQRSSRPWGEGIWLLRGSGDTTFVTCVWRVHWVRPWMRWLAPLLAPLWQRTHHGVMRAGEAGLRRQLARCGGASAAR